MSVRWISRSAEVPSENLKNIRSEKETQKGKMKNTKVQKSKRCENVKKINAAFENPKKFIVIILNTN